MTEVIRSDYEVSSEGAVRHWDIPYDDLEDVTPTPTLPAALTSRIDGTQLTGTILVIDADDEMAVIDFTHSMVYEHDVRNVLTYSEGAEATWGAIDIGDAIFYDRSSTMPANAKLSTSPLDEDGDANPLFGFRVPANDDDVVALGDNTASTQSIAVMQIVGD
jgi:hypothetical protein